VLPWLQPGQHVTAPGSLRPGRTHGGVHRRLQAILLDRLEQIVDSVGFEGFERMIGKRGGKNDSRGLVEPGNVARGLDTVHPGHANVQQHDIRLQALRHTQRFQPVHRFADQFVLF
jgi:hypothetical protein